VIWINEKKRRATHQRRAHRQTWVIIIRMHQIIGISFL